MMDKLSRHEQVWMHAYVMCERSFDVAEWADRALKEFRARFDVEAVELPPQPATGNMCVGQDGVARLHGLRSIYSPFALGMICENCGALANKRS